MKNISIIIPIHEYNDMVKSLMTRAINSVPSGYDIFISTVKDLSENFNWVSELRDNIKVSYDEKNEKSDFCTLVNNVVSDLDSEWFSILEFDDVFTDIWFESVEYEMEYKSDVSVFLPLEELIDFNTDKFIGYGNEAPWATSFSEEIGYIENEPLQQYFDFYLTGGIYNTNDFRSQGFLKPSMKLTFWYEFLLRITKNGKKVYVVPKLGLLHYVDRENSLYDIYRKTITEKESEWWYETAQKEAYYLKDRNKVYKEGEEG